MKKHLTNQALVNELNTQTQKPMNMKTLTGSIKRYFKRRFIHNKADYHYQKAVYYQKEIKYYTTVGAISMLTNELYKKHAYHARYFFRLVKLAERY